MLGVVVLWVAVFWVAVLGVAVLWVAVLGVAVLGIAVLGVAVLGVAVKYTPESALYKPTAQYNSESRPIGPLGGPSPLATRKKLSKPHLPHRTSQL